MFDLIIIGGGPGGYVAAIHAAKQGLRVLLIEKDRLGGTCLNRGCIPTKCFFYDSKLFKEAKTSPVLKARQNLTIDPIKMVARKRGVVNKLISGLEQILHSHDIEIIQGSGELIAPNRVRVAVRDGSTRSYTARNIILATGSRPAVPSFLEIDGKVVQTTDHILDAEDIPHKLLIIGGGVIGMEMAAIYLNLGSEVIILEMLPDILMAEDREVRQTLLKRLRQRGATLYLNANAKEITHQDGAVNVTFEDASGGLQNHQVDRVVVATGRAPNMEGINPSKLGLEMDGSFIGVNARLETNLPGVYAIGDLVGGLMLAHKASAEACVVVENILGHGLEFKPERVPRCIWSLVEIASVGITEQEARETARKIKVGKFPYRASSAANAMGNTEGFVKIVGDAETGEILGVHILGQHATDLIGDPLTAMSMESAVEDLYTAIRPHPTLSETILEAALDWNKAAIHLIRK